MQRSLLIKILTIVATILVCIYGIIGIPKSKEELIANWNHNIRLGLDLRGGSQLMLQVQVQDAFKAEADQVIDRLKDQLLLRAGGDPCFGGAHSDLFKRDARTPPTGDPERCTTVRVLR